MRMCTLPQGATNSIAHMQNAMHKVLREFVPEITIPFLDDIPMKGCATEEKDETLDATGCRKFVSDHIRDVGKILHRLREVHLTLSAEKSRFGVPEILVVGHVCDSFGRRPNPVKVEAVARLVDCRSTTEVRRFLGSCVFFRLSIPHYAHMAEPLYALLKKGRRFSWSLEHHEAMENLKRALQSPPVVRRLDFTCGRPIIVTVDTSPRAIGWVIGQDDADGVRFAGRFGAKILAGRQRDYPQVKRELWGVYTALRTDRNFLIGAVVMLETDCLPLFGMIANCSTPDITMLRWIAYIRNFNPGLKHIAGKENVVTDMLSRARYEGEEEMILAVEEENRREAWCQAREVSVSEVLPFREDLYSGKLRDIGLYLSTLEKPEGCSDAEFKKIRQKAYEFLLREGYLWKREDLDSEAARAFFRRYGVKLKLTSAYNPEGIGKSERRHPPIVHALVKACNGRHREWPMLLPFALWADRTTHSSTTGYMPAELMLGKKPIMPAEEDVPTWATIPWEDGLDRESLLAFRVKQLEGRYEDLMDAQEKLKAARLKNKEGFDKTHRLRPKPIHVGDWVLVYDSSLENRDHPAE
ncbi:hypothetical protein R1sor_014874 [Riccia sorocarpa]|uniref:Reverse transcriptase/retrotransposon-derived protein RNase H-like domain-containing protein n=1 Tax=Riccia sorocarpa TaxID=122646 RepID=A0ABD3HEG7_9MARC